MVKEALKRAIAFMDSIILSKQGRKVMAFIHMLKNVPNFMISSMHEFDQFLHLVDMLSDSYAPLD